MASVPPKNLPKKKAGAGKAPKPASPPVPPVSATESWVYTIGFAFAVVAFVIGVYQTMVERDLASNYWLFMIALGFLFGVRWFRLRQRGK